jgi:hypothetical protein
MGTGENKLPLIVSRDGDCIEAILPMPLPYKPIPAEITALFRGDDIRRSLLLDVVELLYLWCSVAYRKLRGITPPPRARFKVTPALFQMEFVSPATGDSSMFECDPAKIIEFRSNQYSRGLYMHVKDQIKHTFMEDFDDNTVSAIATQVRDLINSHLKIPISAEPVSSDAT